MDQAGETEGPVAEKGTVSFKNMIGTQFYRATYAALQGYVPKMIVHTAVPCDPAVMKIVSTTPMVAKITAEERVHMALAADTNFHAMSLISAGMQLCSECGIVLAAYSITNQDNMFSAARKLQTVAHRMSPPRF